MGAGLISRGSEVLVEPLLCHLSCRLLERLEAWLEACMERLEAYACACFGRADACEVAADLRVADLRESDTLGKDSSV